MVLVSGVTLLEQTPLPDVPLQVGGVTEVTDQNGEFSVLVPADEEVSIVSGLPAISFSVITARGDELASTYLRIDVETLVEPSGICRVAVGGVPHLYFSYRSRGEEALVVPSDRTLNQFVPQTDVEPETILLPGSLGFSRPEASFANGDVWKLLGASVQVQEPVPICSDRGDISCRKVSSNLIEAPELFTRESVRNIAAKALKLLQRERSPPKTRFAPNFFEVAARVIAGIRTPVGRLPADVWVCDAQPPGCVERKFPKKAIRASFQKLCDQPFPDRLKELRNSCEKDANRLKVLLKRLPDTYFDCSGG